MHDDHEEFEQEQVRRDREGDLDQEAWALQESEGSRHTRVDQAIERLEAEVAAREAQAGVGLSMAESERPDRETAVWSGATIRHPDPDTVVPGIDGTTGLSLGGTPAWDAPGADPSKIGAGAEFRQDDPGEARFGDRLRQWLDKEASRPFWKLYREDIAVIAAAIDHDAEDQRGQLAGKDQALVLVRADLRRQVEEAVGGLRETVHSPVMEPTEYYDVIRVEPFLEALGAIFGDRPEGDGTPWPLGDVMRRLCAAADHLLGFHNCDCHGYEEIKAAREAGHRWEGSGVKVPPEHRPTHDDEDEIDPADRELIAAAGMCIEDGLCFYPSCIDRPNPSGADMNGWAVEEVLRRLRSAPQDDGGAPDPRRFDALGERLDKHDAELWALGGPDRWGRYAPSQEPEHEPAHDRETSWRCFHCNQTFSGEAAAEHFGRREDADPPTCISTRHPLVLRLRERIRELEAPLLAQEHLEASERRERQSARYEDREGRVEGVDR